MKKKKNINLLFIFLYSFLLLSTSKVLKEYSIHKNWQLLAFSGGFLAAFVILWLGYKNFVKLKTEKGYKNIFWAFLVIYLSDEFFLQSGPIYLTLLEIILIAFLSVLLNKDSFKKILIYILLYSSYVYFINKYPIVPKSNIFSDKFLEYYQPLITLIDCTVFFLIIVFSNRNNLREKTMVSFIYFSVVPLIIFTFVHYKGIVVMDYQFYTFYTSVFMILMIIALSGKLSEYLTKPLESLATQTKDIAQGNFELIKEDDGENEISILIRNFNNMIVALENTFEKLNEEIKVRKQKENDLEQTLSKLTFSEQRYSSLAENSQDIIWSIDKELKIVYINPALKQILGYDEKDLLGISLLDIIQFDRYRIVQMIYNELRNGIENKQYKNITLKRTFQLQVQDSNNKLKWLDFAVSIVFDENSSIKQIVGVARDITMRIEYEVEISNMNKKLVKANEKLKSLDEMKTSLLSTVSHELRTPLASIKGYSQLLTKKLENDDLSETYLEKINNNVNKLNDMIEDLLSYSRLYFGKISLDIQNFDIVELSREVSEIISANYNNASFEFKCDENSLVCAADKKRIKQVILNLLENAGKFSNSENPSVELVLRKNIHNNFIIVTVKDNGIGIPQSKIDTIFENFYQVDNSERRRYEGLGIGLAIVKKILDLHESDINIQSSLGRGTSISFSLPSGS